MSCDGFEVGLRVQAVSDFQIQENLAAPVGANAHQIHSGDWGEVTRKRKAGSFHWLIIQWDHLNRPLNLDLSQFDLVSPASVGDSGSASSI